MKKYEVRMLEIIDLRIDIEAETPQEAQTIAYEMYPRQRDAFEAITIECDYVDAIREISDLNASEKSHSRRNDGAG